MFSYIITTKSFWTYKRYIYLMAFTANREEARMLWGCSASGPSTSGAERGVVTVSARLNLDWW